MSTSRSKPLPTQELLPRHVVKRHQIPTPPTPPLPHNYEFHPFLPFGKHYPLGCYLLLPKPNSLQRYYNKLGSSYLSSIRFTNLIPNYRFILVIFIVIDSIYDIHYTIIFDPQQEKTIIVSHSHATSFKCHNKHDNLFTSIGEYGYDAMVVLVGEEWRWVAKDRTRREVIRKFRLFLIYFPKEDEENEFELQQEEQNMPQERVAKRRRKRCKITLLDEDRIRNMCASNLAKLEVLYHHLLLKEPITARWMQDDTRDMLDRFDDAATRHTLKWITSYRAIQDEVFVSISPIPTTDSLRSLRRSHFDKLLSHIVAVSTHRTKLPISCKTTFGTF